MTSKAIRWWLSSLAHLGCCGTLEISEATWDRRAQQKERERRSMRFLAYAEVLTPDHPLSKAHADGFKRTPGHLLRDVLRETGGRYEVETDIPLRVREEFRRLASQTGDSQLAALAGAKSIRISLEHLRECDPDSTRIVYGYQLQEDSL